jgi:ferredoxin
MASVVTDACLGCKYTSCVTVCPVDSFHEKENQLVINPEVCISCNQCHEACPVGAIYAEEDLPPHLEKWVAVNEEAENYPHITEKKPPLAHPPSGDKKKDDESGMKFNF